MGQGIAIPHGKSDDVKHIGVAIGILSHGIEWESLDNEKIRIVILFAVSNDTNSAKIN
ncbi:PTS sugar transporter subunit IIA [Lactobacillus sp. R2/2]|nr:PTS sugar transporter subunit IIA [Lactobacillus sp. R2/2]MEB3365375.1 PTS sugar transporter subunit IIA [Lactobacillus sp. R2/2]